MANSVSVVAGVSETIFFGSAGIVTFVPSSSVRVIGKVGAGVAGAVVGRVAVTTGSIVGAAVEPPVEQPTAITASAMRKRRRNRGNRGIEGAAIWVSGV